MAFIVSRYRYCQSSMHILIHQSHDIFMELFVTLFQVIIHDYLIMASRECSVIELFSSLIKALLYARGILRSSAF